MSGSLLARRCRTTSPGPGDTAGIHPAVTTETPARPGGPLPPPKPRRPSPLTRIRLPLWLVLVLLIGVVVGFLFLLAGRSSVDLGPAVKGAERVEMTVTVCDQVLLDAKSDILKSEESARDGLRGLGAKEAPVRVQRSDPCGAPPSPPTTPGATTTTR